MTPDRLAELAEQSAWIKDRGDRVCPCGTRLTARACADMQSWANSRREEQERTQCARLVCEKCKYFKRNFRAWPKKTAKQRRVDECAACGELKPIAAFGMCKNCYAKSRRKNGLSGD